MSTTPEMERHKHCAKQAEALREMGASQAEIEDAFNKCYRPQPDDEQVFPEETHIFNLSRSPTFENTIRERRDCILSVD